MVTLSYTQTWLGETDWQRVTLNILWFKVGPKPDVFGGGNDMVSQMKLITFKYLLEIIWGCVKTPHPFKWFFQTLSFLFPLIVFPSAGFTPWSKNSHERGKEKGKGIVNEGKKGKGEEKKRERKRKGKGKGKGKESERKRKGKRKEKERKRKRKERKKERKRDRKKERRRKRKSKGRVKEETGKRKGKGEEKEEKAVSHTDHFWCQKLSF